MEQDHVDRVLGQWAREWPDLNAAPMGVFGRLTRVTKVAARRMERVFAKHGLTPEAFDVLATLRRSGAPYRLTPTRLFQSMMVTSGTMTNRLDRLEEAGYVQRIPDPGDRRGTLVELTPTGRTLVDRAVVDHLENERGMLEALSHSEQEALAGLLRKLLLALDEGGTL